MSAAIHLNIIAAFDRWTQSDAPLSELLTKALPFVNESVEAARGLRLYHLNEHALMVGAATDDTPRQFILVEDGIVQTEALAHRQPVYGDGSWWVPLNSESSTFGLLEVIVDSATPGDHAEWLTLMGAYLAHALNARELQTLTRKQAVISGELTQATNFRDIASIMAKNLLGHGQFIGINIFQYNGNDEPVAFKVIATASQKHIFNPEMLVDEETAKEFGSLFTDLYQENHPVFAPNLETSEVTGKARQWMQENRIKAFSSLPMRSRGRTFGFITINDTNGTLYLSRTQLRIYQSLADQVGSLVELGRLVESSDYVSEISERQKAAFNEMVAGLDYPEMASIIARNMLPQKGRYLGINEIVYDKRGNAVKWTIRASANREKTYRWDDDFPIKWEDISEEFRQHIFHNQPFPLENVLEVSEGEYGPTFHKWNRDTGARALLAIPIFMNNRALAVLVVVVNEPTHFTREEINAFSTLARQMGALIQVRQLLEQARTARNIVDNLALANRLVTAATDYPNMAQAIMFTVARQMTAAAITLFDQPLHDSEAPQYRRFVGMSSAEHVLPVDAEEHIQDLPDAEQLETLRGGKPLIFDQADNTKLTPLVREHFQTQNIQWAAAFGLRGSGSLLGTLNIYYDAPYSLSREEIDGYATLADQIGITIRSRQLLQESEMAQNMAAQLVQVNHLISVAEDYSEMASAISTFAPDNIEMTGILLFSEPVTFRELPRYIKTEVLATGNEIIRPQIIDVVSQDNTALTAWFERLHQGDMIFVADSRQAGSAVQGTVRFFNERNIYSFSAVGLRVGVRMVGVLVFGAKSEDAFKGLQLDNMRVIAGQVAVAIENRNLINQTADALSFIAEQYEMSNALFQAHEPVDFLNIIYRFTNGLYSSAYLGFVEDDKVRVAARIKDGSTETASDGKYLATYALSDIPQSDDDSNIVMSADTTTLTFQLMTSTQRLLGIVGLQNSRPVEMPLNRMRALHTLIDQVTVTLENRYLLDQSEIALQETRVLYEVNRALLAASDGLGVLNALQEYIAPDAYGLSLATLSYDGMRERTEAYLLDSMITPDKRENAEIALHTTFGAAVMANFNSRWQKLGKELDFIQDIEGTDALGAIANPGMLYFKQNGAKVRSAIIIPIFDGDVMRQQINITFPEPRLFDQRTRRLYEAVRDQVNIVLQNQRLLRQMQHTAGEMTNQVRLLQTINQLASSLSILDNEQDLTDEVAQALVKALRIDHVGITMLNNDGEGSTLVSEFPSTNMIGLQIPRDNPLMIEIRRDHAPILIRDAENETGLSQANREFLKSVGIKAMLFLPLVDVQNRYLGAIGIDAYTDVNAFTPEVVEIGRGIAAQLAVSLQNVRQLTSTREQAEQLQKLAEFGQTIQTKLDVMSIIETVLTRLGNLIPVEKIRFLLYEPATSRLKVVARYEDNTAKTFNEPIILSENSAAGRAWSQRQMVHLPELQVEPGLTSIVDGGSVLAMPIFSRGVALGLIEVAHRTIFVYKDTDLLIFQQVVNQTGVAVENADAYSQSQRLAQSKALVNEIGSQLQQQIDLDSVLSVTVKELGRALNARRARIRLGTEIAPDFEEME